MSNIFEGKSGQQIKAAIQSHYTQWRFEEWTRREGERVCEYHIDVIDIATKEYVYRGVAIIPDGFVLPTKEL